MNKLIVKYENEPNEKKSAGNQETPKQASNGGAYANKRTSKYFRINQK